MKKIFSETPIYETLKDYLSKSPVRMHVPFHNGFSNNDIFPKELYTLDISEVSGYDVDGEDNPIFQSEKITADFFNVKHSFYLTGGASVGLLASLIALNKYGKKVILARNVHKSVINGVILSGLEPIWLDVNFLDEWGIFSRINPDKLQELVSNESGIAGCVIVSPTYEGVISDVKAISDICHRNNFPLIVDEAHGAHLWFLREQKHETRDMRQEKISVGKFSPDLIIQSWHKSLGSLTQTGILHLVNEKFFSYNDIKRSLDLVSSTSPSFLLLLSLELTRKYLTVEAGFKPASTNIFNQLLTLSESLKSEMKEIPNIEIYNSEDPFKIYIKSKNLSGIDFGYELYKNYSIEIESANNIGLLLLIGQGFNENIKNKTVNAIKEIAACKGMPWHAPTKDKPHTNKFKLNPREAFIKGFQNKTNCEYESEIVAPCPPGYAMNVPGMHT